MSKNEEVGNLPKKDPSDPAYTKAFDAVFEALDPLSPRERLEIVAKMAALVDLDLNRPDSIDTTIASVAALIRQASEQMRQPPDRAARTRSALDRYSAIALQPKFPIPDRSKRPVRKQKDEDGIVDIGWCDGALSDGRAFRGEMWSQDQVSMLTIFFSTKGIEDLDSDAICQLLRDEHLVLFKQPTEATRYCSALKWTDDGRNEFWSVNIVVGVDDEKSLLKDSHLIFPYSKSGEPNSMFNPIPIKSAHLV
jgi:hypothetical protein